MISFNRGCRFICISVLIVFGLRCGQAEKIESLGQSNSRIKAREVVELAEIFIRNNGYTTNEAVVPITYESIERGQNDEAILKLRYNTLNPDAYGYTEETTGWVVFFRYSNPRNEKNGRAVTTTLSAEKLQVKHQDILLSGVQVVLGGRQ